jgi:hypothetical protein
MYRQTGWRIPIKSSLPVVTILRLPPEMRYRWLELREKKPRAAARGLVGF